MGVHEDWGTRCERWRGVRSELIDLHGTRVHVLRGEGPEQATGQLLVHGLGGAATNWLEVLPALARLGPVVAPDLPGFGRTRPPRPGASRVDTNARFLRALLDHLGWQRAIVHGNSMGGMLGVLLGELAPERVERLVLASPALPSPTVAMRRTPPRTLVRFAPFALPGLGQLVVPRLWARATPEQLWEDSLDYLYADSGRVHAEYSEVGRDNIAFGRDHAWRAEGLASAAESLVSRLLRSRALWRAVDGISVPTLLLWGDADRLVGRPVFDEVRRRRPDWDHVVLEGTGHCPQVEVPQRYVDAVASWSPTTSGRPGA